MQIHDRGCGSQYASWSGTVWVPQEKKHPWRDLPALYPSKQGKGKNLTLQGCLSWHLKGARNLLYMIWPLLTQTFQAYDSVWRPALFAKLKQVGFGGKTLQLIQSMYRNDSVSFLINGHFSPQLWLSRGVKQGSHFSLTKDETKNFILRLQFESSFVLPFYWKSWYK